MRMSSLMRFWLPTFMNSRSWITLSSFAWMLGLRFEISSKKKVPWLASSKRPCLVWKAPVKEPLVWPNSSLSRRLSTKAEQSTGTNSFFALSLRVWIARATSSFPVPLSPVRSTVLSLGAARLMVEKTSRIAGLFPTMYGTSPKVSTSARAASDSIANMACSWAFRNNRNDNR